MSIKSRTVSFLIAMSLATGAVGCVEDVGTCTVVCTFLNGTTPPSRHGPYDNYSYEECVDKADRTELPGSTVCSAEYSEY